MITLGEAVDRLVIANIKLTYFDHLVYDEINKEVPDGSKIVELSKGARSANENRAKARNEINEIVANLTNTPFEEEYRTYKSRVQ